MAFRFRLQSVLDHRTHLEDLARHFFAAKLGAQKQCEQHIVWLETEHQRARDDMRLYEVEGMPAKEFVLANEYLTVLRLQSLRERSRLPMLRLETEKARAGLIEATRGRKVLESLKERDFAHWRSEQLKAEQRLLDEAAVGAFVRKEMA